MVSRIPRREVWNVLRKYFNIAPESVKTMTGYSNFNYKVTANDCINTVTDRKSTTECFLLKFSDLSHSYYLGNIDMQHEMLKHLHLHGINASIPIESIHGETMVDYSFGDKQYKVQLLTYVDGVSINEAVMNKDEVMNIASDMGLLCGRFHQIMQTFNYDMKTASSIHSVFHTENAPMFEEKLQYVEDIVMRNHLQIHMNIFKKNFLPRLHELKKGFIHGDFSDSNIILEESCTQYREGERQWQINGLIDLEECAYTYLVGEVGICVAYAMLKAASLQADPVEASRQAIQAYQSVSTLSLPEKEVLFDVVTIRLFVSYVSACYECFLEPANAPYLFSQAKNVPAVLEVLDQKGRAHVEVAWFGNPLRYSQQPRCWHKNMSPKK